MKSSSKAFTLIELLVVVSIILILTGGAIAGFAGFGKRQTVKQGGENVKSVLRSVQAKAYNGETVCPTGYSLSGWEVNISSRNYREICVNTSGTPFPQSSTSFSISPPVTITASVAPVLFTTFPKSATPAPYVICVTDGSGNYYKITVDSGGSISDSSSCP